MSVVHYIKFLYPGSFIANESVSVVEVRDVVPPVMPKGAYAYMYYSRTEVQAGGELLIGENRDFSHWTYLGKRYTLADVKALPGDYAILISNMKANRWPGVVKTILGNWAHLNPGDQVIESTRVLA